MGIKCKKIKSIAGLKKLAKAEDGVECFVLLMGCLRSSKHVRYVDKNFEVLNEVDGSNSVYSEEELKESLIGEAIRKGCFYKYE